MVIEPFPVGTLERAATVTTTQELAELLRQLRRRQARQRGGSELTYRTMAARTGWSIGTIAGYFGGQALPPTDRFDVLVTLLDATRAEQGALATARDRVQEGRRRRGPAPSATRWPVPRQLPAGAFRFAGRTVQLAELDALLVPDGPVPTGVIALLSGTAGVGKTALSVHWAHRVAEQFPDGQLYVDLRGFAPDGPPMSAAQAVRGFLDAFGVTAQRIPSDVTAQVGLYRSLMADHRILVILDNARDTEQVRPLLPGSAGCVTIVTSRNQLSSLVAVEGARHVVLDQLPAGEARQLLGRRLGEARIAAEPLAVDEIVRLCARLPLALAIAAARANARPTFPLAALAGELRRAQGSLDVFTDEDASADARVAFSCSYRHLSHTAAALFRRLSIHPGPDVTAPAAASLSGLPPPEARPAMTELARAHLVTEHAPGRYVFHDLLRTYAMEQGCRLDTESDRDATNRRTLDHYLHTANAAALLMYPHRHPVTLAPADPGVTPETLTDREEARAWFEGEHLVLLAAVTQAATTGLAGHSWQLAWALADFLDWRGHWHDLATAQRGALEASRQVADRRGQAHAHRNLARAYIRLSRFIDAQTHLDHAIALSQQIADRLTEAESHLTVSLVLERLGRNWPALAHSQRALELYRATGHVTGQARSLNAVGWYHTQLGDHERALACCQEAVALYLLSGNRTNLPAVMDTLGVAHHNLGNYREATEAYRQSIDLYRESGDRFNEADTLTHLGESYRVAGAPGLALAAWRRALVIMEDLQHPAAHQLYSRLATISSAASPADAAYEVDADAWAPGVVALASQPSDTSGSPGAAGRRRDTW